MVYLHTIQSPIKSNQSFKIFYSIEEDKAEIHFCRDNEEPVIIELDSFELSGLNFNSLIRIFYFRNQTKLT